jgi:hypothetical protein
LGLGVGVSPGYAVPGNGLTPWVAKHLGGRPGPPEDWVIWFMPNIFNRRGVQLNESKTKK